VTVANGLPGRGHPDLQGAVVHPGDARAARPGRDAEREAHPAGDLGGAELVDEQGESRMPIYNDIMTVQELVDIVTFLRPHYQVAVPRRDYPLYYP